MQGAHGKRTAGVGQSEPTAQAVALRGDMALPGSNPGWPLFFQITAQQIAAQGQPQKVTYATQPALKTQFLTTPISQAQKLAGTQQVQTQIQVSVSQYKGWIADAAGAQDSEWPTCRIQTIKMAAPLGELRECHRPITLPQRQQVP